MRIPAVSVPVQGSDEAATGLLLSCLSAMMKAGKQNSRAPINHFFTERLSKKQDRAKLNTMLNALANRLASTSDKHQARGKQILDSAVSDAVSQELEELKGKYQDLSKRFTKFRDNQHVLDAELGRQNDRLLALEKASES
jgi:chromosome segregation ATPase